MDNTKCPSCGNLFLCQSEEIHLCHCASVATSREERQRLMQMWDGCLCSRCLREKLQQIKNELTS